LLNELTHIELQKTSLDLYNWKGSTEAMFKERLGEKVVVIPQARRNLDDANDITGLRSQQPKLLR
jgi:hypothetical protein